MSRRREQILALVQGAEDALGVDEIARRLGVHANTVRFHLDVLVEQGSIERVEPVNERSGRGRPRMGYRTRPGRAKGGTRRYQLLAEMLLSQLAAGPEPAEAAREAGRAWGAHLVTRPAPARIPAEADTGESAEATGRLLAMLEELDFAPEPITGRPGANQEAAGQETAGRPDAPDRIRLRHCPFIELAEPHRELVCTLHLGLMQGALAELDASVTVSDLAPFAEPTACLASLAPTGTDSRAEAGTRP